MENPCCICLREIDVEINGWSEGHNAEPIEKGRCCSECNTLLVVPERLHRLILKSASDLKLRILSETGRHIPFEDITGGDDLDALDERR
jgi:hypothetical protein